MTLLTQGLHHHQQTFHTLDVMKMALEIQDLQNPIKTALSLNLNLKNTHAAWILQFSHIYTFNMKLLTISSRVSQLSVQHSNNTII